MTRECIKKIIDEEGLRGYNFFESRVNAENEIVIVNDSEQWIVYTTDERASKRTGSEKIFDNEAEALENFVKRLRALNVFLNVLEMKETLELRLINLAQKVADMYQDRISQEHYQQLCNAINVCRDYHIKEQGDWGDMYAVVLYEDGIWEYGENPYFEKEIMNMWMLETDILICNCYLGCIAEHDDTPQDMELQGENMPEFVDLLESVIEEKIDYNKIFVFWKEKMCY